MFVSKQDVKVFPFHMIQEKVQLAIDAVEYNCIQAEKEQHARLLLAKEREWNDTHESPYEGNFEEQYPFHEPDPVSIRRAKDKAKQDALKDVLLTLGVKAKASWLLPQVAAYVSKMSLPRVEGKIDPVSFLRDNFAKDDWHKGLYLYCTVHQRGLIVPSQTAVDFRSYSAIVPLLMMPFKRFGGVSYSEWSTKGLSLLMDANLYEAMTFKGSLDISNDEILSIRDKGLTFEKGAKAGERRNPVTYHQLYKIQGTPIGDMPWLCQVMATQIWAAHPMNRISVMVLDWLDWDRMPDPIIDTSVMLAKSTISSIPQDALPWE